MSCISCNLIEVGKSVYNIWFHKVQRQPEEVASDDHRERGTKNEVLTNSSLITDLYAKLASESYSSGIKGKEDIQNS